MYYTDCNFIKREVSGAKPFIMNEKNRKTFVRIVCLVLAVIMVLGTLSIALTSLFG